MACKVVFLGRGSAYLLVWVASYLMDYQDQLGVALREVLVGAHRSGSSVDAVPCLGEGE
jgi:hypothetical protein